jgi:hypothetical protein
LARLCLTTSTNCIAIFLNLIQNLIKQHPKSLILLIRKRKKTESEKRKELKENSQFISNKHQEAKPNINEAEKEIDLPVENSLAGFAMFEQFDNVQLDPYLTKAHASALWELYTLKSHFSYKIRSLVHKFEANFLKLKENNIDELSNLTEEDLHYDLGNSKFYVDYENKTAEYIFNKLNNFI